ncbi:MAG: hypothetical protein ACTSO9_05540 [Candidatus Helarchaeota archaeon]
MPKKDSKIEKEIKKILNDAKIAEEEFRLLDAARLYILASNLLKKIGEFEKSRELIEKAEILKRRESDIKKKSQIEKQRIRDSKKLIELENQLNNTLEIAEVAITEERWSDASKYYYIASNLAQELGENDRYIAFKVKAEEIEKKIK